MCNVCGEEITELEDYVLLDGMKVHYPCGEEQLVGEEPEPVSIKIVECTEPSWFEYTLDKKGNKLSKLTGTPCCYVCAKCGKAESYYLSDGIFVCLDCRTVIQTPIHEEVCTKCGILYERYVWFDPSDCKKCGKSFVD